MEFWDNNKDSFKSAGISTIKGIGKGTKALGKAGVQTYKNQDAKRKGIPVQEQEQEQQQQQQQPQRDPQGMPQVEAGGYSHYGNSISTYRNNTDLNSFPAPPKRNVGAHEVPKFGEPSAYDNIQYQQKQQQQQQPNQQQYLPPNNRPVPQPPTRTEMQPQQTVQQPQPNLNNPSIQQTELSHSNQVPPNNYDYNLQTAQPTATNMSSVSTPLPNSAQVSYQTIPQQEPIQVPIQEEKPKRPLPDPTSFPPPPIHKYVSDSKSLQPRNVKDSSTTGAPSASTKSTSLDVSKVGPPPPKPFASEAGFKSPPPMVSRNTPPLPKRSSPNPTNFSTTLNKTSSTSSLPGGNLPTRSPTPTHIDANPNSTIHKKAPPPKPAKKPTQLSADSTSTTSSGGDHLKGNTEFKVPNFAEEIAKTKNRNKEASTNNADTPIQEENILDLRNQLKKVDFNSKSNNEDQTKSKAAPVKPKPIVKPKPKIMPKPNIGPKPGLKPTPEVGTKLESNAVNNLQKGIQLPSVPRPRSAISSTPSPPPPPPSKNYKRGKAPLPQVESGPPNLDLELGTGWFANFSTPMELPRSLAGLNYNTSYQSRSQGSVTLNTRNINLRLRDLSVLRYTITWTNNDINGARAEVSSFVPSPITSKVPTIEELNNSHERFGNYVASWCEHKMGQKVGSGECWDLAHDALLKGCGKHAFVSTYYHHGYPIIQLQGSGSNGVTFVGGNPPLDQLKRGDILQYTSCKFKDKSTGSVHTFGDPDHTSVVLDTDGEKLILAEQNINNVKLVKKTELCLNNLTDGTVIGYRPMSVEWAGSL